MLMGQALHLSRRTDQRGRKKGEVMRSPQGVALTYPLLRFVLYKLQSLY